MIEAIGIIVPAHDEAESIGDCIAALEAARAHVAPNVETFVVLVLDACRDRTKLIAERSLDRPHCLIEVDCTNVGEARRCGVQRALQHWSHRMRSRIWLANSDADSRVPEHWLRAQLALANRGAEAIAGTVNVDDWRGHSRAKREAFCRFYEAGVGTDHPHVHGANLGVRADVYLEVGGFLGLATGEDHALWNALRRHGKRALSRREISVATSSRRVARAPNGFARFIRELSAPVT
jgi:glycosyltransferase involved in cell wall biosynthesis